MKLGNNLQKERDLYRREVVADPARKSHLPSSTMLALARRQQLPLFWVVKTHSLLYSPSFRRLRLIHSGLPKPPELSALATESDHVEALTWVKDFASPQNKIKRELVELSFSRSSGPGGQNVNKVNTKATLRCPINSSWIPRWAAHALVKNPHYVASSHSLLITSSVHRSQSQNIEECLKKLHSVILQAASDDIQKTASKEQQEKVDRLKKADNARRKTEKMNRSATKQHRKSNGRGWDY
ncbi:RF-1 domain-containing protein [Crepidotus variabilis]|uniref:RF-1 domain-containing protein n=1 Tax=Crepidotus variabilis TaxID=179855 RepID=A0A9P6EQ55_9AGAR|nr:RF-1 domain-containing protein [Crepidotus variabilis]